MANEQMVCDADCLASEMVPIPWTLPALETTRKSARFRMPLAQAPEASGYVMIGDLQISGVASAHPEGVSYVTHTVRMPSWLEKGDMDLAGMARLQDDWNGYGSVAPNETARCGAREVLELLADMDFAPSNVAPSAENGVGISFRNGERYALIECYNTGEIAAVVSRTAGHADSWDVSPSELKEALERIYDHIHGTLAG